MKLTHKRKIGNLGEALAVKYLKSKGFLVLHRNFLRPFGEVDIVAQRAGVIHFVEVKTVAREMLNNRVSCEMEWNPAERVDGRKLARVRRAGETYLSLHGLSDMDRQIDAAIVSVDEKTKTAKVELLENLSLGA